MISITEAVLVKLFKKPGSLIKGQMLANQQSRVVPQKKIDGCGAMPGAEGWRPNNQRVDRANGNQECMVGYLELR
ncbi:hypothetical protein PPACK8108_LOCUS26107 [Phakopsora pachyrhizi]|uniref:Uncharacterized protein n=1 Tax=Phakopsora pachyrhizi TaxID=170000 RepID=A0AAV0BW26_PHAPC|nr:hypothetical protein PPACK8108_LOCUS26107 [Phakopsora pachyrhizi]